MTAPRGRTTAMLAEALTALFAGESVILIGGTAEHARHLHARLADMLATELLLADADPPPDLPPPDRLMRRPYVVAAPATLAPFELRGRTGGRVFVDHAVWDLAPRSATRPLGEALEAFRDRGGKFGEQGSLL